jgi:rubrerythrin
MMTRSQAIQAIRLDIEKEEEAIILYTSQAEQILNPEIKQQLLDIADEERVHVGELQHLLEIFAMEERFLKEGTAEVERSLKNRILRKFKRPKTKRAVKERETRVQYEK